MKLTCGAWLVIVLLASCSGGKTAGTFSETPSAASPPPTAPIPPTFPSPSPSAFPSPSPTPGSGNPPPASLKTGIDGIISPLVDPNGSQGKAVAYVVGILTATYRQVYGYGATVRGGSTVPGANTLFEIGSVSKVFAGTLLALETGKGKMSLTDPIDKYLPATVTAPSYNGTPITLLDLATHYSALPDIPPNAQGKPYPMTGYTATQLGSFLTTESLPRAPGTSYSYSNLGIGLLGYLMGTVEGSDFGTLVQTGISQVLSMPDTTLTPNGAQMARLASGYPDGSTSPAAPIDLGILAGAGALRSTADDLLSFLAAQISPSPTALGAAFELVQKPERSAAFSPLQSGQIGLALDIEANPQYGTLYEKDGQTNGYSTYILYSKTMGIGIVLFATNPKVPPMITTAHSVLGVILGAK